MRQTRSKTLKKSRDKQANKILKYQIKVSKVGGLK
jgi:hypothetical protein